MTQNVNSEYMPKADTIKALQDDCYGRRQIWTLIQLFRKNFDGKEFADIDRKFREVVRKEPAHNIAKPDMTAGKKLDKKRADDIANRPKDAHKKAVESHNLNNETSQEYAKNWINEQRGFK